MAVTASSANFDRAVITANTSHALVLPVNPTANAFIFAGIQDRTTGGNFNSFAGSLNGALSIVNQTLPVAANSVNNALMAYFTPSAAGAETVTCVTSTSINSQVCGGFITSNLGAMTATQDTAQATGTGTTFTSNSITISNGSSGAILAFLKCDNNQAAVPTSLSTNTTNMNDAADAGTRSFILVRTYSGNGTYDISGTLNASSAWVVETLAAQEAGTSGFMPRAMMMGIG